MSRALTSRERIGSGAESSLVMAMRAVRTIGLRLFHIRYASASRAAPLMTNSSIAYINLGASIGRMPRRRTNR